MVADESTPQEPRSKSPGELAVERAQYVRNKLLSQMQGTWNFVCRELESLGFSAYSGFALVSEGFAKIDSELPQHVCPLCVSEEVPRPQCLCKGRGYFTVVESDLFALARVQAPRHAAGETRPIHHVLRELGRVTG